MGGRLTAIYFTCLSRYVMVALPRVSSTSQFPIDQEAFISLKVASGEIEHALSLRSIASLEDLHLLQLIAHADKARSDTSKKS